MTTVDWAAWHDLYDRPDSFLAARLAIVQQRIRDWLDGAPAGSLRVISLCAGEGRDILGVLESHARRGDVSARLVELDPRNVRAAREAVERASLATVSIIQGDASSTDAYAGSVPADLVLACGIFGNVSDLDIRRTILALPTLCASGATVIWTRHRRPPDRTPDIRRWFGDAGFQQIAFDAPAEFSFSVGVHRLRVPPMAFVPGLRMFEFVGYGALLAGSRG